MPGILDRYVLTMFLKVLAITFVSLTGLYIVIDLFQNVDDFAAQSEERGELLRVIVEFYGPRALSFFDRMGPIMALLAAVFAITTLMRTNELTAMMAAGVSKGRIVTPLIYAAVAVSLLGVVNREWFIPAVRHKLMRTAQDWQGVQPKTLRPTYDYRTDVFIGGRHTIARERKILEPHFRLPSTLGDFGHQLAAETATWLPRSAEHPAGYLLEGVHTPSNLAKLKSVAIDGQTVIYAPQDTPWLLPRQCFLASNVSFDQLAGGSIWRQHGSTRELMTQLRNPSLDLGSDARVLLHARLVQPLLDMTLFMLGLPLVLSRDSRNTFVAAGYCLAMVAGFFIVVILCHTLGSNYLLSPAFSAWLPLLIFTPLAYTTAIPLWR